jgi:hypothetical protein
MPSANRQPVQESRYTMAELVDLRDQDLEIVVVNSLGREIHRQFVHRE